MSLYDTKNECLFHAKKLPNKYESYSIDFLADEYCKAMDENNMENKNIYLSALILRFWYTIDRMYNRVKSIGTEREDLFFVLYNCIDVACKYRAWQDPERKTNAQACINTVIASRGVPVLYGEANLQKNTRASLSLDDPISDDGETTFGETIESDDPGFDDNAKCTIQAMISDDKIIEAIIADTIAYKDVFKHFKKTVKEIDEEGHEYKYVNHTSEFWPFKVVQELNLIDAEYTKYFLNTYSVNINILKKAIENLNNANNQKKYKMISKSLETMKSYIY